MNPDEYLKQMKRKGHKIPASIDPHRYGLVDLDAREQSKSIIRGLLNSCDLCRIDIEDEKFTNPCSGLLSAMLIKGVCLIPNYWQLERNITRRCIVVTEASNCNAMYAEIKSHGINDLDLFDLNYMLDTPNEWAEMLSERQPTVCIINVKTKSLAPAEKKIIDDMLTTCIRRGVAILFFDSSSAIKFPGFKTEVKLWSIEGGSAVEVFDVSTGETKAVFYLKYDHGECITQELGKDDLAKIHNRIKRQEKQGVSQNFKMEGM